MKYFIMAFNDGQIIRISHEKHPDITEALKEQYGGITECFFAEARIKRDVLPIARGDVEAVWNEIYRDPETRKFKIRKASFTKISPKIIQ